MPNQPDDVVIANAETTIDEMRSHIDHQSKDAESVDTKAAAILTVTAAGAALVATRVGMLDTDLRKVSAVVTLVAVASLIGSLFQALRPRDVFSYGPNPVTMPRNAEELDRAAYLLWIVDSFAAARQGNVDFLEAKQSWYQRAMRCLVATVVGIAWMTQTGAIV
jgi:hypothetical protein